MTDKEKDYLCPMCVGRPLHRLMLEHRESIPMLVQAKCVKCGYEGLLVEVPKNKKISH